MAQGLAARSTKKLVRNALKAEPGTLTQPAVTRTKPGETETGGTMTNRNVLLGRSKLSEKLTREEIAALDQVTVPPAPAANPPGKNGGGPQRMVRRDLLKFRWSLRVPWLRLQGHRRRPARSRATSGRGAAAARWSSSWAAGDVADNLEDVN